MSNRQHKQDLFDGMKAPIDHEKIWADLVQHPDFPHEKKKRRGLLWFFFGLAALVTAAGMYFYTQPDTVTANVRTTEMVPANQVNPATESQPTVAQLPSENPLKNEREELERKLSFQEPTEVINKAGFEKVNKTKSTKSVLTNPTLELQGKNEVEINHVPFQYPIIHTIEPRIESTQDAPTAYEDMKAEAEWLATQYAHTKQIDESSSHEAINPLTSLYIVPFERQDVDNLSLPEISLIRQPSSAKRKNMRVFVGAFYAADHYNYPSSADENRFVIDSDVSNTYGFEVGLHRALPKQFFVEAGALYRRGSVTHINQRSIISYELADNSGVYLFNEVRAVERNTYKIHIQEWDARLLLGKAFFTSKVRPFVAVGAGYRLSEKSSSTNTIANSEEYSVSKSPYYFGRAGAQVSLNASFDLMTYIETHVNRTYRFYNKAIKYKNYPVQVGLQLGYRF